MSARTCADCGHRLDIHTPDGCVALHLDGSLCACPTPTPERPEGETMKHHTLGYLNPTGLFGPNATPQGCSSTPPARERVVAVVAGIKRFQAARRYGTGWNDALAEVTRALAEADRAAAVAEAVERAAKVCESRAVSLYLQKREDGSRHIAESNEASKCASAIRALPAPEPEEEWCYACGHDAAAHRDHGDLGGCRDCHCSEYQLPPAPEPGEGGTSCISCGTPLEPAALYRCTDCDRGFCKRCALTHFTSHGDRAARSQLVAEQNRHLWQSATAMREALVDIERRARSIGQVQIADIARSGMVATLPAPEPGSATPSAVERYAGLLSQEAILDLIQCSSNPDAIRQRLAYSFAKAEREAVERAVRWCARNGRRETVSRADPNASSETVDEYLARALAALDQEATR